MLAPGAFRSGCNPCSNVCLEKVHVFLACCSLGANGASYYLWGRRREGSTLGADCISPQPHFAVTALKWRLRYTSFTKPRWTLIRPGVSETALSPQRSGQHPQETLVEQGCLRLPALSPGLSVLGPDAWVGAPVCLNESMSPSSGGGRSFQLFKTDFSLLL